MDIKIIVAAHKPYRMPQDSMYLPIQVGKALSRQETGWQGDDTGDNISCKNPNFCELTGLYWAWKNLKADAIGLVHYRRHFAGADISLFDRLLFSLNFDAYKNKWDNILSQAEAEQLLAKAPIILPYKRNYYIETIKNHYIHAHHCEDIEKIREIIAEQHHQYLSAFDQHMNETTSHMFNMFIMQYDYFIKYCTWLFDVLFSLEKILDISKYSVNDARVFGFLGERLLDVWIQTNKILYIENNIIFMEKEFLVKKYINFVKRKFKNDFFNL